MAEPPRHRLGVDEAVREALANNFALQTVTLEAEGAQKRIAPAGALEDPMVELSLMNRPVSSFSSTESEMTGNQLALSQAFPYPGKRSLLVDEATREFEMKTFRRDGSRLELARDVRVAYARLALSQGKLRILNAQRQLLRDTVKNVEARFIAGQMSQNDYLALQLESGMLEKEVAQLRADEAIATGDLNHLLGRSEHEEEIETASLTLRREPLLKKDAHELDELALAQSPMLKAEASQVAAAKARESYEKLNTRPDFDLMASYLQREPAMGGNGDDLVSLGVKFNVPVWSSSKQAEKQAEAAINTRRVSSNFAEQRNHLLHYVHTALKEASSSEFQARLYGETLKALSDQALQASANAFTAGQGGYLGFLDLLRHRYEIEGAYLEALARYDMSVASLKAITGEV